MPAKRVLIIEDEMLVAMNIEDALIDGGYDVVAVAGRVEKALSIIENEPGIDGVVMDLNLAGQSSIPVADRLADNATPFIVLSGYGASGLPERHRGVPTLSKPFDPDRLVALLNGVIGA